MHLFIDFPQTYQKERTYIAETIFNRFLGVKISINFTKRNNIEIYSEDRNQCLLLSDRLFSTSSDNWLKPVSLPSQPLLKWNFSYINDLIFTNHSNVPIIYGQNQNNDDFFQVSDQKIYLGLDIFGSIFFMLTRYEETVKKERDKFDRFPASASLNFQENLLNRPIVDEYIEILWVLLKKLWPNLERKPKQFKVLASHDVDYPYQYRFKSFSKLVTNIGGDVIKRRNLKQGLSRINKWSQVKHGSLKTDPFNTFNWIMDLSEVHNLTSAFYFITARTDSKRDGNYNLENPLIRQLLCTIHQRGHEIGLHPSFNTYLDSKQTCKEFKVLKTVCQQEGIQQSCWGGRQHYLRWHNPTTWQNWEDAGLNYDSTLTFADMAGFRCGTCHEFPVYNLLTRKALKLVERPLIVMECSVLDERYMGLQKDLSEAFDYIAGLKTLCRKFNGTFTLLWHNSSFERSEYRDLYKQILAA
ncbi:hypothetical protein D0962_27975 [Leptolyngbyaceae cyanobacterium CCMR0082]|uniref:DUF7033 domain-containing protein n=1 Tax=Adonisia turfae CCMR0082 TaxID=2304604 RepID=A0A6M0SDK3_9CYAN|nr:polysaccharide deacetylase family protein [Adonisia turfae]MDV3350379.1 polysaccharide deacetylase family protein [Leptothoe sp. LEGE 181152]NEZ66554.1 hypothetical protein [Adonisia turfae CCMR0082]